MIIIRPGASYCKSSYLLRRMFFIISIFFLFFFMFLYSLSAVHIYDLYHIHITSLSSYNGYKLNSLLTCFQQGFIPQLVEHCTSIVEVMDPFGVSELFFGLSLQLLKLLRNGKITFTSTIFSLCYFKLPCHRQFIVWKVL